MSDVTQLLAAMDAGEPTAADQLLPLVYEELRKLAAVKMAWEKPGQTLQATALVHEAWLRLVGSEERKAWNSRSHFFGAAAEAMRRILVDRARQKARVRHGGIVGQHDLRRRGEHLSLEEILAHQSERDRRDEQRAVAPLKPAADAILIDTSHRSVHDVVDELEAIIRRLKSPANNR